MSTPTDRVNLHRTPVYQQIAVHLRREIRQHRRAGEKLETVLQLGARFGVSGLTISQALSILVQEGLVESRKGSGTYVSATRPAARVALILPAGVGDGTASFFWLRLAHDLHRRLLAKGMAVQVNLADGGSDRPEAVAAAIAMGVKASAPCLQGYAASGVPMVGLDEEFSRRASFSVPGMIREAVGVFQHFGRRRLAMLTVQSDTAGAPSSWLAHLFTQQLTAAGLSVEPQWLRGLPPGGTAEGDVAHIFQSQWKDKATRPDGLLIADDTAFPAAAAALLRLGIHIPDELLVVVATNRGSGMYIPFPAVSIENDPEELAEVLLDLLSATLDGTAATSPQSRVLEPKVMGMAMVEAALRIPLKATA